VPKHHRPRPEATKILLKRVGWKSSFEFVELQQEFSATMVLVTQDPPKPFFSPTRFSCSPPAVCCGPDSIEEALPGACQ
jgi:hypothetical protein